MKKQSLLVPLLAVLLVSGCATNPFAKSYQSFTDRMPPGLQQRLLPPSSSPRIITVSGQAFTNEARRLTEGGYVLLGVASFAGSNPTDQQLIEQAKKVGADAALWSAEHHHTEQGVRPLVTYEPGTISSTTETGSANVNVNGSGGYAIGSGAYAGQSTTTTEGTIKTQYVPYQRQVYSHLVSFWRRARPGAFGARCVPVPDDLRTALKRNTGAYVTEIVTDSPAFKANIMRGDVIIQLSDKSVSSHQALNALLPTVLGQKVTVRVLREGQPIDISVQMNQEL